MTGWPTRNWGCRIGTCIIEGMNAVLIENRVLRVTVLADKGAELVELLHKPTDVDVLWRAPTGILNPARGVASVATTAGAFMDAYGGGWQELFPTLGAPTEYYGAAMGEHGEVALLPWDVTIDRDDPDAVSVTFAVQCRRSPFRLRRTLTLEGAASPTLQLDEVAVNEGGETLELMWGHHPVFGPPFLEPGCSIRLPGGQVQAVKPTDGVFLPQGEATEWPRYVTTDGPEADLSVVGPGSPQQVDELYVRGLPDGWYQITNQRLAVGFELRWDVEVFPYLWWWRTLGPAAGYPWYSRTFMLGLEPFSSVPPDFRSAAREGTTLKLRPGQTRSCRLEATIFTLGEAGSEELRVS